MTGKRLEHKRLVPQRGVCVYVQTFDCIFMFVGHFTLLKSTCICSPEAKLVRYSQGVCNKTFTFCLSQKAWQHAPLLRLKLCESKTFTQDYSGITQQGQMKGGTVLRDRIQPNIHIIQYFATDSRNELGVHFLYLRPSQEKEADKGGKDVSRYLLSTFDLSVFC